MKTRVILWLAGTAALCCASLWFGRSQSRAVYDQNPLRIDLALLTSLRGGDTTNVAEKLDAMLELETLAAMRNRSSLKDRERKILDRTLEGVASYRQQHPWLIDTNTNGIPPLNLPGQVKWIAEQKQVEVFLQRFVLTDGQPNQGGAGNSHLAGQ